MLNHGNLRDLCPPRETRCQPLNQFSMKQKTFPEGEGWERRGRRGERRRKWTMSLQHSQGDTQRKDLILSLALLEERCMGLKQSKRREKRGKIKPPRLLTKKLVRRCTLQTIICSSLNKERAEDSICLCEVSMSESVKALISKSKS